MAKVIFLHLSVILFTGGSASFHAGIPTPREADPPAKETPPARSRPTPKGEIEGDQIQAYSQGGNSGGSDPGPHPRGKFGGSGPDQHPRGKFRGIRTSPLSLPEADSGIQSMSGRYASYWNALLT